jgi:transcriptional regulator with XRE-family HTH domain
MTPEEFKASLDRLNWKQSDFCRMAGVDKNTPSRWINGTTPVPGWAPRFLEMATEIKKLAALVEPPKA